VSSRLLARRRRNAVIIIDTPGMPVDKELRSSMSAQENVLTALMPSSVAATIYLVFTARSDGDLLGRIAGIAAFYSAWAILNLVTTKPYEKGHYALIPCCVGCLLADSWRYGKVLALIGAAGTLLAFMIAGKRVLMWPASKTAHVSTKPLYWVYVLQVYFLASLFSWSLITYKLYQTMSV